MIRRLLYQSAPLGMPVAIILAIMGWTLHIGLSLGAWEPAIMVAVAVGICLAGCLAGCAQAWYLGRGAR